MNLAGRILQQLTHVRGISEQLLQAFTQPEDWTYQLAPGTNHALWFAGHMAVCDDWLISVVDAKRSKQLDDWNELFGTGSQPMSDPDTYPPPAEVLDVMRERRQVLVELLEGCSDEKLTEAAPEEVSEYCTDLGAVFESTIWHEAMHAGQVTLIRRALGHAPLFAVTPAEAK